MLKKEVPVFLVVGLLTVLIDFGIYRLLTAFDLFGIDIAKGVSFLTGTLFAYFANRQWTFDHQHQGHHNIALFVALYASTLCVNVGTNAIMLHLLANVSLSIQLAFLVATGLSASLNFLGMKYFVFTANKEVRCT